VCRHIEPEEGDVLVLPSGAEWAISDWISERSVKVSQKGSPHLREWDLVEEYGEGVSLSAEFPEDEYESHRLYWHVQKVRHEHVSLYRTYPPRHLDLDSNGVSTFDETGETFLRISQNEAERLEKTSDDPYVLLTTLSERSFFSFQWLLRTQSGLPLAIAQPEMFDAARGAAPIVEASGGDTYPQPIKIIEASSPEEHLNTSRLKLFVRSPVYKALDQIRVEENEKKGPDVAVVRHSDEFEYLEELLDDVQSHLEDEDFDTKNHSIEKKSREPSQDEVPHPLDGFVLE
jgi:hypothetical protein